MESIHSNYSIVVYIVFEDFACPRLVKLWRLVEQHKVCQVMTLVNAGKRRKIIGKSQVCTRVDQHISIIMSINVRILITLLYI